MEREKTFRGISARLAVEYLVKLGGERVENDDDGDGNGRTERQRATVAGDGWRATVREDEKEPIGPTLSLTPVTVRFEGDDDRLDDLVEAFSRKAMRAGG